MKNVSARTHTRRLLRLAEILAKHRDSKSSTRGTKFDMGTWGVHEGDHAPKLTEGFCGTTACALGHAAMDPAFQRAGLRIEWEEEGGVPCGDPSCSQCAGRSKSYTADIYFGGYEGDDAGAAFFGLSEGEASNVFLATSATKKETIEKLRRYAKDRAELRGWL